MQGEGKFLEELGGQWNLITRNNYTEHSMPSRISCQLRQKVDDKKWKLLFLHIISKGLIQLSSQWEILH